MKSFVEIINTSEESENGEKEFPTFSEAISGEIEESFTGKDKVSSAYEKLHSLQLEVQKLEKTLLTLRDQFLTAEKDSSSRELLKSQMISTSKKKAEVEKKVKDAEIETQRAIASDNLEIEELDVF